MYSIYLINKINKINVTPTAKTNSDRFKLAFSLIFHLKYTRKKLIIYVQPNNQVNQHKPMCDYIAIF